MTRLTWIVFSLNLFACAAAPNTGGTCGNGVCDPGETAATCEEDCARPDAGTGTCGDHVCQSSETQQSCPADCGTPPPNVVCGDGTCASSETVSGCPADCAAKLLIDNLSTYTIEYVYAWSCSGTNTHTDILGANVLLPNYHIEFDNFPPGCWDFQAVTTTNLTANQNNVQLQARVLETWNLN